MKPQNIIIILFCTLILSSCFTKNLKKGADFNSNLVHKIAIGETTKTEIVNWFGKPNSSRSNDDGNEIYEYKFINVDGKFMFLVVTTASKTERYEKNLDITFRDNIVHDFSYVEGPIKHEDFEKRYRFSNISVKPPKDNKWYIRFLTDKGIIFVRITDDPKAQSILSFITIHDWENDLDQATGIEKVVDKHIEKDKEDKRYTKYQNKKSKFCLNDFKGYLVSGNAHDMEVPGAKGISFFLDATSIYLTHPSLKGKYIILGYSQRYRDMVTPIDLEAEIKPVIESLQYVIGEKGDIKL